MGRPRPLLGDSGTGMPNSSQHQAGSGPRAQSPPNLAPALQRVLQLGLHHHQSGRPAEAEPLYRQVLAAAPGHAGALHLLGVLCFQTGRTEEAAGLIGKAVEIDGNQASWLTNLGLVLQSLGRLDEAIARHAEALRVDPQSAEAHFNRGTGLQHKGDLDAAETDYREALRLRPEHAETHNNLGTVLQARHRLEPAVESYRAALRLNPDHADALNNLGSALQALGRIEEAIAQFRTALQVNPGNHEAFNNLGNALKDLGRFGEALAAYAEAQRIAPHHPDAHWNESMVRLLLGDFAAGWPKFEWRWQARGTQPHGLTVPLWCGDRLAGKTILIHCEQGFGDCIQCIRYVARVKRLGAQVVVLSPPELEVLLRTVPGTDAVVTRMAEAPPCDLRIPVMSLPLMFRTRLDTIPASIPYLSAAPDSVRRWQDRLSELERPRIGVVWRGRPSHANDRNRSIPLALLAPLLRPEHGSFVSLTREPADEEAGLLARLPACRDVGSDLADFAETAAAIDALDLVIAVDTAVAHLAGALGKPVWLLLPHIPDWRWLLDRTDSPWYPAMRLFRQQRRGDWAGVIAAVAAALAEWQAGVAPADSAEPGRQ